MRRRRQVVEQADQLASEIRAIEERRIAELSEVLTPAEAEFLAIADRKGKTAHRIGWPDFLVEDQGSVIAVEVRRSGEPITPAQERMFAVLDRAGIGVYVWSPSAPDKLVPWRRYTLEPRKLPRTSRGVTGPSRAQRRRRA